MQGRWISQDPIGFEAGDINLYRYVENEATAETDPSGLQGYSGGHHWIPFSVAWDLYHEGILDDWERDYFLGRTSGPLVDGHDFCAEYGDVNHGAYNEEVKNQLRNWKKAKNSHQYSIENVANNIRDGKSWNGRRNPKISSFNGGIMGDMTDYAKSNISKFDGGTRDEIVQRGRNSLRNSGRILLVGGFLGGLLSVAEAKEQSEEVVRILTDGEAMRRAKAAALQGKINSFDYCITTAGASEPSVYDELLGVNPIFANIFLKAAQDGIEKMRADLDKLQREMIENNSKR